MNLKDWLEASPGRATWLAEKIGVSEASVSLYKKNGVPIEHMPTVADLTAGDVTIGEMVEHAIECREKNAAKRAA